MYTKYTISMQMDTRQVQVRTDSYSLGKVPYIHFINLFCQKVYNMYSYGSRPRAKGPGFPSQCKKYSNRQITPISVIIATEYSYLLEKCQLRICENKDK